MVKEWHEHTVAYEQNQITLEKFDVIFIELQQFSVFF